MASASIPERPFTLIPASCRTTRHSCASQASSTHTTILCPPRDSARGLSLLCLLFPNLPHIDFQKRAITLRFNRLNWGGQELLLFPNDELMGKNDFDFFPVDQAEHFIAVDRETLRNRDLVDIPEETIQTNKKGARILHTKKIPILDATGEPGFLLGISEDITEAKKTQEALLQAQEEAERANPVN